MIFVNTVFERLRVQKMKEIVSFTNYAREQINKAHLNVIKLATHGESVIVWDKLDFARYHQNRLRVDSLLHVMKTTCSGFVKPEQIDSLCFLLKKKETHLMHIMEVVRIYEESVSDYSDLDRKMSVRDGKAKEAQSSAFSEKVLSIRDRKVRQIEAYTDSLRLQNRNLNFKLYDLISFLDNQVIDVFAKRNLDA